MNDTPRLDYHGINIFNCNQLIYLKPSMQSNDSGLTKSITFEKLIYLFSKLSLVKNAKISDNENSNEDDDLKKILKSVNKNIVKLNKICPSMGIKQKNKSLKSLNLPLKKRFSDDYTKKGKKFKYIKPEIFHSLIEKNQNSSIVVKIKKNINDTYRIVDKNNLQKLQQNIDYVFKQKEDLNKNKALSYKRIKSNIFIDIKPLTDYENQACNCKKPIDSNIGCTDYCLNRMMYVECNPTLCPCEEKCSNQRIQKYMWSKDVDIYKTKDRGFGVKTSKPLKSGQLIMEYTGEVVSVKEFETRSQTPAYNNGRHHYCLYFDRKCVIDARHKGSICRFVNHSCAPNCVMQKWSVNGLGRMVLVAKPTNSGGIPAGTELTYDYNFTCFKGKSAQKCLCGSGPETCRGYITTSNGVSNNLIDNNNTFCELTNNRSGSKTVNKLNETIKREAKSSRFSRPIRRPNKSQLSRNEKSIKKTSESIGANNSTHQPKSRKGKINLALKGTAPIRKALTSLRRQMLNSRYRVHSSQKLGLAVKSSSPINLSQYDIFRDIVREASSPNAVAQNTPVLRRSAATVKSEEMSHSFPISNNESPELDKHVRYKIVKDEGSQQDFSKPKVLTDIKCGRQSKPGKLQQSLIYPTSKKYCKTLRNAETNRANKKLLPSKKRYLSKSSDLTPFSPLNKDGIELDSEIYHKKNTLDISPLKLKRRSHSSHKIKPEHNSSSNLKRSHDSSSPSLERDDCYQKVKRGRKCLKDKNCNLSPCHPVPKTMYNTIERYWLFNFYVHHAWTPVCIVTRLLLAYLVETFMFTLPKSKSKRSSQISTGNKNMGRAYRIPNPDIDKILYHRNESNCLALTNNHKSGPAKKDHHNRSLFVRRAFRTVLGAYMRKLNSEPKLLKWFAHEINERPVAENFIVNTENVERLGILKEIYELVKFHQDTRIKEWKHPIFPFMAQSEHQGNIDKCISQGILSFKQLEKMYFEGSHLSQPLSNDTTISFLNFDKDFRNVIETFKQLHRCNVYEQKIGCKKLQKLRDTLSSVEEFYVTVVNARIHSLKRLFPTEDIRLKEIPIVPYDTVMTNLNGLTTPSSNLSIKMEENKDDQSDIIIPPKIGTSDEDFLSLDIVDCHCRIFREEGTMIQCEQCQTWQHSECVSDIYSPNTSTDGTKKLKIVPESDSSHIQNESLEKNSEVLEALSTCQTTDPSYKCYKCLGLEPPQEIELYTAVVQDFDKEKSANTNRGLDEAKAETPNNIDEKKSQELTYYWTTLSQTKHFKIKCGECYYVLRAPDSTSQDYCPLKPVRGSTTTSTNVRIEDMDVFRCLYIFKDKENRRWAQGHHFYRPTETFHEPSRRFYLNEVLLVYIYETVPIESIYKPCWVLNYSTFCKGRPLTEKPCPPNSNEANDSIQAGTDICNFPLWSRHFSDMVLPDENDIYICQLKVDRKARKFDRVKYKYNCILKSYCFYTFPESLVPKRIYFPHEIPKTYTQSDPNLKYLRVTDKFEENKVSKTEHIKVAKNFKNNSVKPYQYEQYLKPIFDKLAILEMFKEMLPNLVTKVTGSRKTKSKTQKMQDLDSLIKNIQMV